MTFYRLVAFLILAIGLKAQAPTVIQVGAPVAPAVVNGNFLGLYNGKAGRWSGSGAPGSSFTFSVMGDFYTDYTNHHLYGCYAVSGPCTAVGVGNWTQIDITVAGTVTTFSGSGPSWLTWTVTNPTTTPAVSLAPTTGQTSGRVIGTCGAATSFAPCALVAGDLPLTLSANTAITNGQFTTPTIASFTNATHNHTNAAGGGQITDAALSAAVSIAKGGHGQTTQQAGFDALAPTATRAGDVSYWNGTHYVNLAGNNSGTNCFQENSSGAPSWATCGAGGSTTATSIKTALSVTDTGTANAYAGCDTNSTAPVDGLVVILKALNDNTAGSTYNHCTAGVKPIQTAYGAAMQAGSIRADGAGSPSGVILRYSTAASAGTGAWQNMTPGQVQLASQTTANYGSFPQANGAGITTWAQPFNPGDGRRTSLVECNGRHWDLSNTAKVGAGFDYGGTAVTGSASTGSGTQLPGCTLTTDSTSGHYVTYNLTGDDKIFKTGRNLQFDTTIALSATTNTRNWIGLSACSAATDAGTATPCSTGFIGFRYDTGASDSSWRCIVATGSATNVDSSVAPSTNQVRLKLIADDTNNAIHFYIDGTEVCLATSVANYPAATFLTFHITETTLTSGTKGVTMAYQWIQGDK